MGLAGGVDARRCSIIVGHHQLCCGSFKVNCSYREGDLVLFYDIMPLNGERASARRYDSGKLIPVAVQFFVEMIADAVPGEFRRALPAEGFKHIELHWTCDPSIPTAAFAAFYSRGELSKSSILL